MTTGGGLYRYQLQDRVLVVGFVGATHTLRFVGKANRIVDFFGEKLSEPFVAQVVMDLLARHAIRHRFAMMAPQPAQDGVPFHYALYVENAGELAADKVAQLTEELDQALAANFHYDYCRRLGQLSSARVTLIHDGAANYLRGCQARGQKLGNIKPTFLDGDTIWAELLLHDVR